MHAKTYLKLMEGSRSVESMLVEIKQIQNRQTQFKIAMELNSNQVSYLDKRTGNFT